MIPDHLPGSPAPSIHVIVPAETMAVGPTGTAINWSGVASRKGRSERAGVAPSSYRGAA